jgi:hypothetical protein
MKRKRQDSDAVPGVFFRFLRIIILSRYGYCYDYWYKGME